MKPTPRGPLPFDEVVRRHGATVLRVCRAVLGPGADADDAWSETFLAALRAWPAAPAAEVTGRRRRARPGADPDCAPDPGPDAGPDPAVADVGRPPVDNVEAWLVRIAHRKAIDVIRARARRPVASAPPSAADVGVAGPDGDPTSDVWAAVARLPDRQRLAVAYHWFGGLPHTETAQLTGSTPAAVRRAAADGLAALRRVLSDDPASSRPPGARS